MRLRLSYSVSMALIFIIMLTGCEPSSVTPLPPLPTLAQFPTATSEIAQVTETAPSVAELVTNAPPPTNTELQLIATNTEANSTATITPIAPTLTPTLRPIEPTSFQIITPLPVVTEARYADITYDEAFDLLYDTPEIIIPMAHAIQIYARGQQRGLQNNFMLSVGDCNSESDWYLQTLLDDVPPDVGVDATYYDDEVIQRTIAYYSNAFDFKGQSVNSGLNAASVMDPLWANPDLCPAGESPLTCDYRFTRPFASLIMFGANDINVLSTAGYEMAMRQIIETTLSRDIIPILSTFSVRPVDDTIYATGIRFNGVLIRLAEEYQLPLVNFWLATRTLDDNGILPDNAHLTVAGFNIRNQLTVEVLNQIRIGMINDEALQ